MPVFGVSVKLKYWLAVTAAPCVLAVVKVETTASDGVGFPYVVLAGRALANAEPAVIADATESALLSEEARDEAAKL